MRSGSRSATSPWRRLRPDARPGTSPASAGAGLASSIVAVLDALLAVILAPACAACKLPLDFPARDVVCPGCWAAIVPLTPPFCTSCGDPLPTWRVDARASGRCPRCTRKPSSIARSRAIGSYDGRLRDILHALKYDGRRSIAAPLGALMQEHGKDILQGADVVVPVPLHRRRHRLRGFNQAADLARALGLPVVHALRRQRDTASQTSLPAARRHANVRGSFRMRRRARVRGTCVVLVDDVSTTGATLDACARVLLEAGAKEVRALTAARVVSLRP